MEQGRIHLLLRGDELTVKGKTQMRQIQATEHAVPVGAIALGLPHVIPRGFRGLGGKQGLDIVKSPRQAQPLLVHAVALGVFGEKIPPRKFRAQKAMPPRPSPTP